MTIVNSHDQLRQDPAWRLLNYKHSVRVPRFATINPDHDEMFGTPQYDLDHPNEALDMFVTIKDLLEYHLNGVVPIFKEYERARMIVEDVKELIDNWHIEIMQGVDVCDPPLEYLQLLEEFAAAIYPQARISKALDIRNDTIQMTALERYVNQRNKVKIGTVDSRINALPVEVQSAMDLVSGSHSRRFKEE